MRDRRNNSLPYRTNPPLFHQPFYKDWTVILGLAMTMVGARISAETYGNPDYFEVSDWVALSIDTVIGAGLYAFLFGPIPASIRRGRRLRNTLSVDVESTGLSRRMYWGLVAIVALVTSLAVIFTNEGTVVAGASTEKCGPRGLDTLCVKATVLQTNKLSLVSNWTYRETRSVSGAEVKEIAWETIIDCSLRKADVVNLSASNSMGSSVVIPASDRWQMINGIQSTQNEEFIISVCQSS
jgi:hypothetical protein